MTTESYAVEERYFRWLYSHIGSVHDLNPSHSHWKLAERLHRRIFEVTVKMDVNREGEGVDHARDLEMKRVHGVTVVTSSSHAVSLRC